MTVGWAVMLFRDPSQWMLKVRKIWRNCSAGCCWRSAPCRWVQHRACLAFFRSCCIQISISRLGRNPNLASPRPLRHCCGALPQDEQKRAAALAPYRVPAPKRGVIGNSRYSSVLRRQIVQASRDKSGCVAGPHVLPVESAEGTNAVPCGRDRQDHNCGSTCWQSRLLSTQLHAVGVACFRGRVFWATGVAAQLPDGLVPPRPPRRRPVLIFGEPGLEKDNLAALVHFGSPNHAAPFVRLDCDK